MSLKQVDIPQVRPTDINPLGALYACYEDRGWEAPGKDAAIELLGDACYVLRIITRQPLTANSEEAKALREIIRQTPTVAVAAHHGRPWFNPHQPAGVGQTDLFVGRQNQNHPRPFSELIDQLDFNGGGYDVIKIIPKHEIDHPAQEAFIKTIRTGECEYLRFGSLDKRDFAFLDIGACDAAGWIIKRLVDDLRFVAQEGWFYHRTRMPGYVQLLEHIGNRDNDRAALLASRICAGIEDPKQAIAALLDVLHGRL